MFGFEIGTNEYNGLTIEITPDESPENPRNWDSLGTMVCEHGRHELGDKDGMGKLERAVRADIKFRAYWEDTMDFNVLPDLMRAAEKCLDIIALPLYLHDHSGLSMNTTGFSSVFDSGCVGTIFCTREQAREKLNTKNLRSSHIVGIKEGFQAEVSVYNQYLEGDIWAYAVVGANSDDVNTCWGIYGFDHCCEEAQQSANNYLRGKAVADKSREMSEKEISKEQLQTAVKYLQKDIILHEARTKLGGYYVLDEGKLAAALEVTAPPPRYQTPAEFEHILKQVQWPKMFIFAKYKNRWVETIAEKRGSTIWYFFFNDQNNALIAECISSVYVPEKPE